MYSTSNGSLIKCQVNYLPGENFPLYVGTLLEYSTSIAVTLETVGLYSLLCRVDFPLATVSRNCVNIK
jgi:hypothetical protein